MASKGRHTGVGDELILAFDCSLRSTNAHNPATTSGPDRLSDAGHAALWRNILTAATHLRGQNSVERHAPIVQLRAGRADNPVYFIEAGSSEFNLTKLINSDRSIFAISIPWPSAWHAAAVNNDIHELPTMHQLVAPYVAALSAHCRSRHCEVVGFSFGGLMAFEIAHQLHAQGRIVEMVMLLDAPAEYPAAHQIVWQKLKKTWQRSNLPDSGNELSQSLASRLKTSWSIIRWMFITKMNGLCRRLGNPATQDHGDVTMKFDDKGVPIRWGLIERLYSKAEKSYQLRRLDSRGVLFRIDPSEGTLERTLDDTLGWNGLFSNGLNIIPVPGTHLTMMQQPHVLTLANELSNVMNRDKREEAYEGFASGRSLQSNTRVHPVLWLSDREGNCSES